MASKRSSGLSLTVRPPAFGLPTACPKCLPSYLYLNLAEASFNLYYSLNAPDSEDLPIAELHVVDKFPQVKCGWISGLSSEPGGVEKFLNEEKVCDLDENLSELQNSECAAFKSLVTSWLADALNLELWSKENDSVVEQVYFSHLPWPINVGIKWFMRRQVMSQLGVNKDNVKVREEEIYKRAFHAYEALSSKKEASSYFFSDRPSSLDASLLAHLFFILSAPLEGSKLRKELQEKHSQLVRYAEIKREDLLKSNPRVSVVDSISSTPTSSSRPKNKASRPHEPPKKQTPKEKEFKKKGRMFVLAQLAALIGYFLLTGLTYDFAEDEEDEDDDEED